MDPRRVHYLLLHYLLLKWDARTSSRIEINCLCRCVRSQTRRMNTRLFNTYKLLFKWLNTWKTYRYIQWWTQSAIQNVHKANICSTLYRIYFDMTPFLISLAILLALALKKSIACFRVLNLKNRSRSSASLEPLVKLYGFDLSLWSTSSRTSDFCNSLLVRTEWFFLPLFFVMSMST